MANDKAQSNPAAIALVDCNNFYVSSERLFNAKLNKKPVVVLSNNDGNVISRSNEAKEFVPMGAPYFKYKSLLEAKKAFVFSSNYELYGDMSDRVMRTLETCSPEVEVYSIDEAFIGLEETQKGFDYLGRHIRETIYKHVGIPVGVGIAETKTLAKIANRIAKKSEKAAGCLDLYKSRFQDVALGRTDVADVWGIGARSVEKLAFAGVRTALDFKNADLRWVKKNLTVTGGRTLLELRGMRCLPLELEPPPKKNITKSQSFGQTVANRATLHMAMSYFLTSAVDKMRRHRLAARSVTVFVSTNRYAPGEQYANAFEYKSIFPSDDFLEIQLWANRAFDRVFRDGVSYKKCGVILGGLMPTELRTGRLFDDLDPKLEKLNKAIDAINRKFGRGTIHTLRASIGKWEMKREMMSPRYTTRWKEMPAIGDGAFRLAEDLDDSAVDRNLTAKIADRGMTGKTVNWSFAGNASGMSSAFHNLIEI